METSSEVIKNAVRENYAKIAVNSQESVGCGTSSCCSPKDFDLVSTQLGYSKDELNAVPEGSNLGLGCGNPQAIANLKEGETVLDLGSGAGFDCFLAAQQVGKNGKVIGVDFTHEMLGKARKNAQKGNYSNVEFRLGEIEHLPVADFCVDVIISNCVINLSTDKQSVFNEAFRVLKKGGRLAVSDVVATAILPEEVKKDLALFSGCVAGAELIENIEKMLQNAGFSKITITPKYESQEFIREWAPGKRIEDYTVSANIEAVK
ncbi:arsenite methyltransferase [bacterium]|nr:arsenite methyltransferase [bacterium]